jgi:hypothetical protein
VAQIHQKTETSVANEALSCLKQPAIIHIDADDSNTARIIRKFFASERDALLREYPWNFASTRALLQAQVQKPVFGFEYMYAMPHDCMAVRHLPDATNDDDWKIEKRAILTDLAPPLKVIYTRFAYEVALWDALFRKAFARRLAVACGPELSADMELIKKAETEADEMLKKAYPSDAAEGTPEDLSDGDWLDTRWC